MANSNEQMNGRAESHPHSHPLWAMDEAQRISKIGSYEVDLQNNRQTWSRQSAVNFGYPPETLMESDGWQNAFHPDDKDEVYRRWSACVESKQDWDYEYRIIRPNGEEAIIHGLGRIIFENGEAIKIIGTLHDVTEQRRIETKLREQERLLIQAARLSSLGEMAAGIAHEINNPLTVIFAKIIATQNALSKLPQNIKPSKLIADCELIAKMVYRIEEIIRGLRAFASDGDNMPFSRASVQTIVDDALLLCRRRISKKSIELQLDIACPMQEIECRSVQVSQVLVNLLNNAIDAIPSSSKKWIRLKVSSDGKTTEFSVSDSGLGVPNVLRSKIMEPFFTTKEVGKGTGLGLSISSGIAQSHGGELRLTESKPTTFVLSIPVKRP